MHAVVWQELPAVSVTDLLCHFLQGLQLRVLDEAELHDEVVVVFVAGVDVGLGTHAADAVEVVDVDVDKDTEQAAQDLLADLLEVLGEGNSYSRGEDVLVVDERLYPVHQQVHVLEGRQLGGLLVEASVLPAILVA